MIDSDRKSAVRRLVFRYVESPSLRHLRSPPSINQLVEDIFDAIDHEPSIWRKWRGEREALLKAAADCWVPVEDLRKFLDEMPGPRLTLTDVAQRLRAFHDDPYESYPNEALREGCLAIYEREKHEGTELPAIIGALQEYVEAETARLRTEGKAARRHRQEADRLALERRFLAGADCKWTSIQESPELYTRKNGRAYRLKPAADKRWDLFRIEDVDDRGALIGTYGSRKDVDKILLELAYKPEPRW